MKKLLTVVGLNENVASFIKEQQYEVLTEDQINESNASEIEIIMSNGGGVVSKALLDKLPNVKIIDNFGVGYDGVDVAECKKRDIAICTTPGVLTEDVADLAISLMLNVSRKITFANNFIADGKWEQNHKLALATKVSGKKVGIVGLGRIGNAVAKRACAFDMEIYYYDNFIENKNYTKVDDLIKLASLVDYLIICAAATEENRNLINAEVLKALGTEGFLINVARGSLVDEQALIDAIVNNQIKGAGLDVFVKEPYIPQQLIGRDNVVVTPHIASATVETRLLMANIVIDNMKAFLEGRDLPTKLKL